MTVKSFSRIKGIVIACIIALCCVSNLNAQTFDVKTNLLYDATTTINLGAEVKLAPKWTFDLSGNLNAWRFSDGKQWRHWMVQPEARYWLCNAFAGHFFGAHLLGGQYNFGHINLPSFLGNRLSKLKDYRYQGWYGGLGIAYGYTWILSRHWSLEAEIGFGWVYTRFDKFECKDCGQKIDSDHPHNYVGPTKAAINLVYVF